MTAERITTAAELDALPVGSVAVLADQTVIERAGLDFWLATGQTIVIWHKTVQKHVADLTIIRRPGRDLIAAAEARGAREVPPQGEWITAVGAERRRQREQGYTDEHDREQGADYLLDLAIEYGRRGEAVKAAALVQAARQVVAHALAEAEARGARAAASPGEPDLLDAITDADDLRGRVRAVMRALRSIEAERDQARAALRDVKALASTWSQRAARKILAILARAELAGSGRG